MAAKKALVTGGAGFVGANIARRLLADGHEVHVFVRPESSAWRLEGVGDGLRVRPVDVCDTDTVRRAVNDIRPDWVFHLAVYGAYPEQRDAGRMVDVNLRGTMNLVTACADVGFDAFVHAGSSSEYGFKDHAPVETDRLEPNSDYAVTKASSTLYCRYAAAEHRLPIRTLRLYSIYGPFEEPTRLFPTLVTLGLKGSLPPLASPETARDYVYVDDAVEAFVRAATAERDTFGEIYNLGTGVQTSLSDVVEIARDVMGIEMNPDWNSMPDRQWDTRTWVANNSRIHADLGWEPRHSVRDGLRELVAWFSAAPERIAFYDAARASAVSR